MFEAHTHLEKRIGKKKVVKSVEPQTILFCLRRDEPTVGNGTASPVPASCVLRVQHPRFMKLLGSPLTTRCRRAPNTMNLAFHIRARTVCASSIRDCQALA